MQAGVLLKVFTKGFYHVNNLQFANNFSSSPWTKGNLDKLAGVINLFKFITTSRLKLDLSKSTIVAITTILWGNQAFIKQQKQPNK